MGREQLRELEEHGMYISVPSGNSMLPMLRGGQDAVEIHMLESRPRRYDVVMYVKDDMQGVIHRVFAWQDDICVICGDNNIKKEYVRPEQIKGVMTRFYRNGRWHEATDFSYRCYAVLWTELYFMRGTYFRCRRLLSKIKRKLIG